MRTHTGLVRDHNEDNFLVLENRGIYMVADGMGGHAAGKVASHECVESVRRFFEGELEEMTFAEQPEAALDELPEKAAELSLSLRVANRRIFEASARDRELAGMGTTAVGMRIYGETAAISHAGDSRCYLLRSNRLSQLTVDHSLSNFLLALGRDAEAQMAEATMSNVIMRALGLEADVIIDTQETMIMSGDRFVLCSDGLSDLVDDADIEEQLLSGAARDDIADTLVDLALDAGGRDNITVMIVDIIGSDDIRQPAEGDTLPITPISAVPGLDGIKTKKMIAAAAANPVGLDDTIPEDPIDD